VVVRFLVIQDVADGGRVYAEDSCKPLDRFRFWPSFERRGIPLSMSRGFHGDGLWALKPLIAASVPVIEAVQIRLIAHIWPDARDSRPRFAR